MNSEKFPNPGESEIIWPCVICGELREMVLFEKLKIKKDELESIPKLKEFVNAAFYECTRCKELYLIKEKELRKYHYNDDFYLIL